MSVSQFQPGLCSHWTNTLLLQALPGVFSLWLGCCDPLPEQVLSHEPWCSDLVRAAEWSWWMDGQDAFCMPAVLILATGMSINSPGSGLQALLCPSRVLHLSQHSALPSGFGLQRRLGEEQLSRNPGIIFLTQLFASFLTSLAAVQLTAQLFQGAALWMPHKGWSPPPRQV